MTAPSVPAVDAEIPAVEREVVLDMVRRAWPALPAVIAVAGLFRGADGAFSAAFAVALVIGNFLLAAGSTCPPSASP